MEKKSGIIVLDNWRALIKYVKLRRENQKLWGVVDEYRRFYK